VRNLVNFTCFTSTKVQKMTQRTLLALQPLLLHKGTDMRTSPPPPHPPHASLLHRLRVACGSLHGGSEYVCGVQEVAEIKVESGVYSAPRIQGLLSEFSRRQVG